jgi:hypothetical protein
MGNNILTSKFYDTPFHTRFKSSSRSFSSAGGIFKLADSENRPLPKKTDDITHETIHPAALKCASRRPDLIELVKSNPDVVWKLKPFEELVQKMWSFDPNKKPRSEEAKAAAKEEITEQKSFISSIKEQTSNFLLRRKGSVKKNTVQNSTVKRNSTMNGASVK